MTTITVRTQAGETKQQLILRKLGCRSVGEAINANGLQNFTGDLWAELEAIACQTVCAQRRTAKLNSIFRSLRSTL